MKPSKKKEIPPARLLPRWTAPAFLGWSAIVLAIYLPREWPTISAFPDVLDQFVTMHFFHAYTLQVLVGCAVAGWIAIVAWALGLKIMQRFFPNDGLGASEAWALGIGSGLGAFCSIVFILGLCQAWDRRVFLALLVLGSALAVFLFIRNKNLSISSDKSARVPWQPAWIFLLTVLFLLFFLDEAAPEIFYDALYYHIAVPNLYRLSHAIYAMPTLLFSNFVMMTHMLFGLALTVGNTLSAKFLHGVCAAAMLVTFLAFEKRFFARGAGWIAAVIFFSLPLVGMNVTTSGTDVAGSYFQLIATFALLRALFEPSTRWWVLSGFLTGVSAGCKYPAFPYIPIAILIILWKRRREDRLDWKSVLREAAIFSAAAGAVVLIILLRNVFFHHNPLYPFGGVQWGVPRISPRDWEIFISDANTRVLGSEFTSLSRLWRFLMHPWFITMEGRSNGDYVGPLLLMGLPLLFLVRAPSPAWRWLARYSALLWILWMVSTTTPRYGLPALAMISLLLGEALARGFENSAWRPAVFATITVAALVNIASFAMVIYSRAGWRVVGGLEDQDAYLSEMHAGYPTPPYEGILWMNQHLPEGSKILFAGEARSYYSRFPLVPSSVPDPQPLVAFSEQAADGAAMAAQLRAQGITTIFLNYAEAVRTESYGLFVWNARSWTVFDDFWKRYVRLVWKSERMEPGNPKALYVFEVMPEAQAAAPHTPPPDPFERWRPK